MNNKAAQAYFQTKVSTTDQGQLLLLLYDGALNFLQQAREKMLEKDYAAKGILISKVIDIVSELANTLNLEKGGTLAENLNNLYFLCTTRLLQANLKMNVEQLDSVATILSGLRSAYAQIISTPEAQKVAAQIATKINSAGSMTQRGALVTNITQAPAAIGQVQARMAYGQQTVQMPQAAPVAPVSVMSAPVAPVSVMSAPVAPVSSVPVTSAPVAQAVPQAGQAVTQPAPVAAQAAATPASVPAATPAPVTPQAAPQNIVQASAIVSPAPAPAPSAAPAATPAAPTAAPAPPPPPAAPAPQVGLGLAAPQLNRKLASYAKMG